MARSEPKKLERIAVIGAGTIGASWAAYFLSRGPAVRVRSRHNEFTHGQYARLPNQLFNLNGALVPTGISAGEWCHGGRTPDHRTRRRRH